VRLYHRNILSDIGWHCDEASNGVEALERVHAQDPAYDLYLVDVNMPRLDGYAFLRELRQLPEALQAPALMISTEAQPQDASAGFAAGANCYLVKPSQPHGLVLSAALLLGERAVADAAARAMAAAGAHA
jgi:two-component system, chemotaxis family, chemotaxis protein CheY